MNLLEVENLCKTFPTFSLKDVSFKIEEGYIMG
ncbi:MAG: ABC transporter ATP-binding protein, partial [Spirochaetaceae bacterium]|nr:ABC transporter ATP-binding protein [Spirochaetaceae bacterium]